MRARLAEWVLCGLALSLGAAGCGGDDDGGGGGGDADGAPEDAPDGAPSTGDCPEDSFPDDACTGPTSELTLYDGSQEFRDDGAVIENVEIHTEEGLYVPASDVTFRNVKIVFTGDLDATFTMVNLNYNSGTVFEDCILDGQGKVARAITGSGVTVRNCEIMGVGNAIETESPLHVEDNYIHDIVTADGTDWHSDGIQTPAGADDVTVRHNTIILTGPETGAINVMSDGEDAATDVLIERNLMAGGGYTMYTAELGDNYQVLDNHFSTQIYPNVGYYNIWYWGDGEATGVTISGNVIHETDAPADENL